MADSNRRDFGTNFAYHGTELKRQKNKRCINGCGVCLCFKVSVSPPFYSPNKNPVKKIRNFRLTRAGERTRILRHTVLGIWRNGRR